MTEYYFFKLVFTKWQKFAQKKITHTARFIIIKGFVNSLSPKIFSGVGSPYVSLCFFTPQASPARVTIALGASKSPVPIQLQVYVI